MKLNVKAKYLKEFVKESKSEEIKEAMSHRLWFGDDDRSVEVDTNHLTDKYIKILQTVLKKYHEDGSTNGALQNISLYFKIQKDPQGAKAGKLESLKEGLTQYINKHSLKKWLFKEKDGQFYAYVVNKIVYEPSQGTDYPASVSLHMKYFLDGSQNSATLNWSFHEIKGKTMKELLEEGGYIIASQTMIDDYTNHVELFRKRYQEVGEQFITDGWGHTTGSYYNNRVQKLLVDGVYSKLVIDTDTDFDMKPSTLITNGSYWSKNEEVLSVPIHPMIRVFNLEEHSNFKVHVSDLRPYVYDKDIINKLVLPKEVMELIEILSLGTQTVLEDIVSGKAAGVIIGCVGKPGVGKTLSAEVYAEYLKRPLYTVQCAQLGTTPDDLEKKLKEVLSRAARWNAILLIDEADVYIRRRGQDIIQNAIVGVFLRVLEYYKGIMFMTTNLSNDIDDAIESRFTAKITYVDHTKEELAKIWKILSDQFKAGLGDVVIKTLVEKYPHIAGRSIRSMLKLGKMLANFRKCDINLDIIEHAAKFSILEENKETK